MAHHKRGRPKNRRFTKVPNGNWAVMSGPWKQEHIAQLGELEQLDEQDLLPIPSKDS